MEEQAVQDPSPEIPVDIPPVSSPRAALNAAKKLDEVINISPGGEEGKDGDTSPDDSVSLNVAEGGSNSTEEENDDGKVKTPTMSKQTLFLGVDSKPRSLVDAGELTPISDEAKRKKMVYEKKMAAATTNTATHGNAAQRSSKQTMIMGVSAKGRDMADRIELTPEQIALKELNQKKLNAPPVTTNTATGGNAPGGINRAKTKGDLVLGVDAKARELVDAGEELETSEEAKHKKMVYEKKKAAATESTATSGEKAEANKKRSKQSLMMGVSGKARNMISEEGMTAEQIALKEVNKKKLKERSERHRSERESSGDY